MNRIVLSLLGAACLAASAQGDVLAQWTFEKSQPGGATASGVVAEEGVFAETSTASRTAGGQSKGTGNGSETAWRAVNWGVGKCFEFKTGTSGYTNLSVSWAQIAYDGAPRDFTLSYSTDGISFTDIAQYVVLQRVTEPNTGWNASRHRDMHDFSFDLSEIPEVNDQQAVFFRLTNTTTAAAGEGAVTKEGSIRLDDFAVTGVITEP